MIFQLCLQQKTHTVQETELENNLNTGKTKLLKEKKSKTKRRVSVVVEK